MGIVTVEDVTLVGVHSTEKCAGRSCVIHNPLDHHMRSWPLRWRQDRGIFERICRKHGCGHPDPSQFEYWAELKILDTEALHGCCGCCMDVD